MMTAVDIAIYIENHTKNEVAQNLSLQLQLPITTDVKSHRFILAYTEERLELRVTNERMQPVYVDFFTKELQQRLQKSTPRTELIARAVGIKGKYYPNVIDTTAGLGSDAIVLAKLGCTVDMIERSPIIAALLQDGLDRGKQKQPELFENLNLHCEDSRDFLKRYTADVIYLDPMFPTRTKSALVKKEMRIIKEIVGSDEDATELFNLAMKVATKRVVVKRPLHAPTITENKPDITYKAKASRFDVYFP